MAKEKRKLITRRPVDPRRHYKIAVVLASLVLGLLVLFNCDRTVHSVSSQELGYNASQHGWPLVFLTREFKDEVPNYIRYLRSNDWPLPTVEGEVRSWNIANLLMDVIGSMMILTIVYWFIRTVVVRFDANREKKTDDPATEAI